MALPPATSGLLRLLKNLSGEVSVGSDVVLEDQSLGNDGGGPYDAGEDRDPVEVLLDHGRAGQRRRDSATEEVRQTTALAPVQEDQQNEHETGDHQDDGDENRHAVSVVGPADPARRRGRRPRYWRPPLPLRRGS